jgi:hypothetical protein
VSTSNLEHPETFAARLTYPDDIDIVIEEKQKLHIREYLLTALIMRPCVLTTNFIPRFHTHTTHCVSDTQTLKPSGSGGHQVVEKLHDAIDTVRLQDFQNNDRRTLRSRVIRFSPVGQYHTLTYCRPISTVSGAMAFLRRVSGERIGSGGCEGQPEANFF